ncbi:MAG TPA: DUF488 family protein [Euzebyales bacterium]|nr:DUF488 family protein [Euzebyales bacterium]
MTARIWLRRAYDPATRNDGYRVLVDRIWPRGVSKQDAAIDDWARDLAPSDDLRRWFDHEPQRWDQFQRRYRAELEERRDALDALVDRVKQGRVTLVYGARDQQHNNAVVLRDVLEEQRAPR